MITAALLAGGLAAGAWWMGSLRRLPAAPGADPDRRPLSVVIPARNEERTLPLLLESLAACREDVAEVLVVDDASTDGTATVADRLGATVIRIEGGPPPGWTGKPYACSRGAEAATGELLLFLDADVTVHPGAIRQLLHAQRRHGGLVSVQPYHRVERRYEELSAMCNVVSMIGTGAFARWPSPSRPAAFGPCLLTSTADYRAAGGHAAVRGELVDDIQLARRYAAAGLPVHCFTGTGAISFRMYPGGLSQLVEGWTKNLAAGAGLADRAGVVAGVWFVASCAGVGGAGIDAVVHAGSIGRSQAALVVAGWLAVTLELRWMLRRIGAFRWTTALLHPIPVLAFVAIFARSVWSSRIRRVVRWRGREIAAGRSN
jgi:hypothetical protein